jgi:hypothetical protein
MNVSQIMGNQGLEIMNRMFAAAVLTMYSGTMPATPETALSGNTALVAWTFNTTGPFTSPPTFGSSKMTAAANLVASSVNPTSNGTVVFARCVITTSAWAVSTAYAYGTIRSNSGNNYLCVGAGTSAGSGGPTTTVEGITDGTVTWNYIGSTTSTVLSDYTVGTSASDIIVGTTTISVGTNVNISSFTQSIPVV